MFEYLRLDHADGLLAEDGHVLARLLGLPLLLQVADSNIQTSNIQTFRHSSIYTQVGKGLEGLSEGLGLGLHEPFFSTRIPHIELPHSTWNDSLLEDVVVDGG